MSRALRRSQLEEDHGCMPATALSCRGSAFLSSFWARRYPHEQAKRSRSTSWAARPIASGTPSKWCYCSRTSFQVDRSSPDPRAGKQRLVSDRQPGAGHSTFLADGLGKGVDRDQAALFRTNRRALPERRHQLVGPGVVDRPRLERLALLAFERERPAPGHPLEHTRAFALDHHQARVLGINLAARRIAGPIHGTE